MSSAPKAVATYEDDLTQSATKIRENTRTMERGTEFVRECSSRVKSGDTPLLSTCDSFLQKQNIEIGKFLAENQVTIEELIYPYTIPSNALTFLAQDSSNVTSSNDLTIVAEHSRAGASFLKLISMIGQECLSKSEANDMSGVKTCISIADSLNSHWREFNQNTKLEFDKVLGTAIP